MSTLVLISVIAGAALLVVALALRAPRTDRDWAADQAVPARITQEAGRVRIEHLRDFRHREDGSWVERYLDATYAPGDVRRVWFVLAPFARRWRGLAHGFVSFELTGDRFVAVSVEARREADEEYSLLGGLLRRFEMTYVIGTEEDVIGLRAVKGDTLFLYPSRASPEQASALFVDMLTRAEELRTKPEFYHTFVHNCMTALRDHVNRLEGVSLPYGWGILLPGYSDRLALEHGLLDAEGDIDQVRRRYRVDQRARELLEGAPAEPDFSRALRRGGGPGHSGDGPRTPGGGRR